VKGGSAIAGDKHVEWLPFGVPAGSAKIKAMGMNPRVRESEGKEFPPTTANPDLDLRGEKDRDPGAGWIARITAQFGGVGTGLFRSRWRTWCWWRSVGRFARFKGVSCS